MGKDLKGNDTSVIVASPPGIEERIALLPEGGTRHNGGAYYALADSHVRWLTPGQPSLGPADGNTVGFGL